jgi:hypothetical protein
MGCLVSEVHVLLFTFPSFLSLLPLFQNLEMGFGKCPKFSYKNHPFTPSPTATQKKRGIERKDGMFKIKALERHYWFPAYTIPEFMAGETIDDLACCGVRCFSTEFLIHSGLWAVFFCGRGCGCVVSGVCYCHFP